jgi:hypothetical protein
VFGVVPVVAATPTLSNATTRRPRRARRRGPDPSCRGCRGSAAADERHVALAEVAVGVLDPGLGRSPVAVGPRRRRRFGASVVLGSSTSGHGAPFGSSVLKPQSRQARRVRAFARRRAMAVQRTEIETIRGWRSTGVDWRARVAARCAVLTAPNGAHRWPR